MKPVPEGSCSIQEFNWIWKKLEHFVLLTDRVLTAHTNALLEELLTFMMQLLNQALNSSRSGQSRIYHLCLWQNMYVFLWSIYDWHQNNCTLLQLHGLVWQLLCSLIISPVFEGKKLSYFSLKNCTIQENVHW